MKVALYCRVSTEEQASSGFSLRQQLEALRRYCKDHDIEVVGEFQDTSSGANLDRPGLDALRDRISLGGVELVLCQDGDSISREPAHVYILREELLKYGTTLRSLNDPGDDSPEGALHDGILDQLAKFERESPLSGHYCFTEAIADLDDDMMDNGLSYGSSETAARRRQEFYRQAGLRVKVGEELEISLGVDGITVGADESAPGSIRSPTETP